MARDDSTRVLEALNVLHNIPRKTLLAFKAELHALMQNLGDDSLAVTHTPTTKVKDPTTHVEELMQLLTQNLEMMERELSELSLKLEPEWVTGDPRIVDIRMAGTRGETSSEAKLRKILGQRSLAKEFHDWRKSKPKTKEGRRNGQITTFISDNLHRFPARDIAERGIKCGQKVFAIEKLLGVGFSAILIFCSTKFEAIPYGQLNNLMKAINGRDSIKELGERKTTWFNEQQETYNKWTQTTKSKRCLQDNLSSQSKRQKSLELAQDHHISTASPTVGASATDPLTAPGSTNVSSDVTPLPAQQIHSDVHEQSQRPPNPLPSKNHVSSSDGFNTHNTSGMAVGNTVHQSFHNTRQETQGSVLHGEEPIREDADNGPSRSSDPAPSHTSSITSMGSECHQGREHICQGNMEARNLIRINEREYHHQLRQSLDGSQSNAMSNDLTMGLLLQAANDASHENGERNDGINAMATVPFQNMPPEPFSVTAGGTQHLHGLETTTSAVSNVYNDAWPLSQPSDVWPLSRSFDVWAFSQSLDDDSQFSQTLDPSTCNDVSQFSQPLDPRTCDDAWQYSREISFTSTPSSATPNRTANHEAF